MNEYQKLINSIHFGGVKKYSEHSTTPLEEQKIQRIKHKKDLIQPREDGKLNAEFVQEYDIGNLIINKQDVMDVERSLRKSTELDKKGIRDKLNKHINAKLDKTNNNSV